MKDVKISGNSLSKIAKPDPLVCKWNGKRKLTILFYVNIGIVVYSSSFLASSKPCDAYFIK